MKLFPIILSVLSLFLFSCGNSGKNSELEKKIEVDSTLSKLNSPELKAVNKELLADPNNPELYFKRGKIYFGNHDLEAAKNDALRAIKLDSLKSDYFILLSDSYFTANETRMAKESLERCLKINPSSIEANLKLAELYFYVKKYQEAINYANSALKVNENTSKAYFIKGMCYKESGDTAIAISSFQTAVEQDNTIIDAYLELGVLLTKKKNALALEYLNSALKIDPANEDVVYNIGYYFQSKGDYKAAIETYKKLLAKNINYREAHYNLGAIEVASSKNYKEAVKYFTNAINADANYADAYFARGVCYEELKDKINAAADYQMALQIEPNHQFAIENLNNMDK
ncbi:MAG: tetratricopeptide repeat protein [Bacteroidetes bacterium]|nr:tetratricopeptide repeat protein [Bacteroidota bacterium]